MTAFANWRHTPTVCRNERDHLVGVAQVSRNRSPIAAQRGASPLIQARIEVELDGDALER